MAQLDLFGFYEEAKPDKKQGKPPGDENQPVKEMAAQVLKPPAIIEIENDEQAIIQEEGQQLQQILPKQQPGVEEAMPATEVQFGEAGSAEEFGPAQTIQAVPFEQEPETEEVQGEEAFTPVQETPVEKPFFEETAALAEDRPLFIEAQQPENIAIPGQPSLIEPLAIEEPATGNAAGDEVIEFNQTLFGKAVERGTPGPAKRAVVQKGKRGRKSFKDIDAEIALVEVPGDEELFQKLYYPISQVAQWFNVNTSLLRFWENEFDILKPRKNRKGDRMFRPEDIKNLQVIYHLLRERKFSIEGAKKYIKQNKSRAEVNIQLIQSLKKFRSFLLEMKANLGA